MSPNLTFIGLPSVAYLDLAEYQIETVDSETLDWKDVFSEALEWREIGEPQEAAAQLLRLAKMLSVSKLDDEDRDYVQHRALCYYALCQAEAHTETGYGQDQRTCAEYALSALHINRSHLLDVLAPADWQESMCLAMGGMLEQLHRCTDLEATSNLIVELASSRSPHVRREVALAYLRLLQAVEHENTLPPSMRIDAIRIKLKECIAANWSEELNLGTQAHRMGWHELIPRVLEEYNTRWGDLHSSLRLCVASTDLSAVSSRRERVFRAIAKFGKLAAQQQTVLLEDFREVLSRCLSDYLDERKTASLKAHDLIMRKLQSLSDRIGEEPSLLGTGLLLPLVRHLSKLIQQDYEDRWQQGAPNIQIALAKPSYPLSFQDHEIEVLLHVTNTGNLEAPHFRVELQVGEDSRDYLQILTSSTTLDSLPVTTKPIPLAFQIHVAKPCMDAYLRYRMSWQGFKSEEYTDGTIRLVAQRDVDWDSPNPYRLQPIVSLDRLKGRDEILGALYRGVESGGSFYITGQKRVGKSSIAKALGRKLTDSGWLVVEVLWGELVGASLEAVFQEIGGRIEQAARSEFVPQTERDTLPSRAEFEDSFAIAFSRFRHRFHTAYPDVRLLLILDDFDELPEDFYLGPRGDAFFTALRATVDDPLICLLFVGGEKLSRIQKVQGGRLNTVMPKTVDYLEHPESFRELVIYPVHDILEFDERSISRIFVASAGNPFYATFICRNIYDRSVTRKTAFITEQDVEAAVEQITHEAEEGQFNHFWQDGPHVGTEQQHMISDLSALCLMALANAVETPEDRINREAILESALLKKQDRRLAELVLTQLEARRVLIRDGNKLRAKVPLLVSWLKGAGGRMLRDMPFARELQAELDAELYRISEGQIREVAEHLIYREERVNEVRVRDWLNQFSEPRHRYLAFLLLKRLKELGYIDRERMQQLAAECYDRARALAGLSSPPVSISLDPRNRPQNVFVSTADEAGDSGANIVRLFRDVTRVTKPRHGALTSVIKGIKDFLHSTDAQKGCILMLVNDLIASGQSARREIGLARQQLDQQVPAWRARLILFYIALAGVDSALESLKDAEPDLQILVGHEFDNRVVAFDPRARIFEDELMREEAEGLARRIGARLVSSSQALGWNQAGLLVLLPDNCPNTTLPLFWQSSSEAGLPWTPLFPRL